VALTTEDITLDFTDGQKTFRVTQLPSTRANKLLLRLIRLLGGGMPTGKGVEMYASLVSRIAERCTDQEWEDVRREAFATVEFNGKPVTVPGKGAAGNIDLIMGGDPQNDWLLLGHALRIHLGPFWRALTAKLGGERAGSLLEKLSTLSGLSTGSAKTDPDTATSTIGKPD
jgi:hypothetical protein